MYVNVLATKYIYDMLFELLVFSIQKLFDLHGNNGFHGCLR